MGYCPSHLVFRLRQLLHACCVFRRLALGNGDEDESLIGAVSVRDDGWSAIIYNRAPRSNATPSSRITDPKQRRTGYVDEHYGRTSEIVLLRTPQKAFTAFHIRECLRASF